MKVFQSDLVTILTDCKIPKRIFESFPKSNDLLAVSLYFLCSKVPITFSYSTTVQKIQFFEESSPYNFLHEAFQDLHSNYLGRFNISEYASKYSQKLTIFSKSSDDNVQNIICCISHLISIPILKKSSLIPPFIISKTFTESLFLLAYSVQLIFNALSENNSEMMETESNFLFSFVLLFLIYLRNKLIFFNILK